MIEIILTDIEGTTSSLSYVRDVMFPYSYSRLESFLRAHWEDEEVRRIIGLLSERLGVDVDLERAVETFKRWIEEDRKETALKELQGLIWEEGFKKGELKGHIYEDAYRKLKEWKEKGLRLYVYSSGSVKAQRLFFSHTDYGDLTHLFDGFFDTTVGNKKSPESYEKIAQAIGTDPDRMLFLSDVEEELDSACAVGMQTYRLARDGLDVNSKHRIARSFDDIIF